MTSPAVPPSASALAKIQSDFQKVDLDWTNIVQDESKISIDQKSAANDRAHIETQAHTTFGGTDEGVYNYNSAASAAMHQETAKIVALNASVESLANDIEENDPECNLKNLLSSLEQVNLGFTTQGTNGYTYIETSTGDSSSTSEGHLESVLKTICAMITDQIQIDQDLAEGNASGGGTNAQDALAAIQLEGVEHTLLTNLNQALTTLANNAQADINVEDLKADTDHSAIALAMGYDDASIAAAKAAKEQDERVIATVSFVKSSLATVTASFQTQEAFSAITQAITGIIANVKSILADTHMSSADKLKALNSLSQMLLGFLQIVLQIAQNVRSHNQEKIDEANLQAQTDNMHTFETDATILSDMNKIQTQVAIIQDVVKALTAVMMAAFIATGNIGGAITCAVFFAMQETGALQDLTNDISKGEHSSVGAEFTVAGIALLATIGGTAAIDALVAKIAEKVAAVVAEVAEDVEENMDKVLMQSVEKAVGKATPPADADEALITAASSTGRDEETTAAAAAASATEAAAQEAGEPTLAEQIAAKASKDAEAKVDAVLQKLIAETKRLAAKNAVLQFCKETSLFSATNLKNLSQTIATDQPGKELTEYVAAAVRSAVRESIDRSAGLADKVALDELTGKELDEAITAIAKEASSCGNSTLRQATDYAAAQEAKKSLEEAEEGIKKWLQIAKSKLPKLGNRVLSAASYTLLQERLNAGESFHGSNSTTRAFAEAGNILVSIMSGLMQGKLLGDLSGIVDMMASGNGGKGMIAMIAIGVLANMMSEAANTASNFMVSKMLTEEAYAEKGIAASQATNNLLRLISDRTQDLSSSNSPFQAEENRLHQDQQWLAAHQYDGINEGCQVLAAQSV